MNVLDKVLRADPARKSRLHDEQGGRAPLGELARLPRRLGEFAAVKCGAYPHIPWWPQGAIDAVEAFLTPSCRVVEFGSGSSTRWLAERAAHVTSVESNRAWFDRVNERLGALENVDYRFREPAAYTDIDPPGPIDLVIVDGERRYECIQWALARLAPGARLYLDNSDADKANLARTAPPFAARNCLLEAERQARVRLEVFRGFPPATFAVTEGFLATVEPS